jgi:hypothetical protein
VPEAPPVEWTIALGDTAGLGIVAGLAGAGAGAASAAAGAAGFGSAGMAGFASGAGVCANPVDAGAMRGASNNNRVIQVRVIRVGLRGPAR